MFKDRLRELRVKANLSQYELSEKIYVSRSTIAKWEAGIGIPSNVNLESLCAFFNVDEEWLLDRNDLKNLLYKNNNINIKINITSIIGIVLALGLFFLSFIGIIKTTYTAHDGGVAIMPLIITSIAVLLNLKIIPFLLSYFLLLIISIINLIKIVDDKYKLKLLIINIILIGISILVYLTSYLISLNLYIN